MTTPSNLPPSSLAIHTFIRIRLPKFLWGRGHQPHLNIIVDGSPWRSFQGFSKRMRSSSAILPHVGQGWYDYFFFSGWSSHCCLRSTSLGLDSMKYVIGNQKETCQSQSVTPEDFTLVLKFLWDFSSMQQVIFFILLCRSDNIVWCLRNAPPT